MVTNHLKGENMLISEASKFRRLSTSASLIIWPVLMAGAALAQPKMGQTAADVYQAASSEPSRLTESIIIGLPGILLWIIAVVGMVHLVRQKGVVLVHIGGLFALFGALGHMIIVTLYLVLQGIPSNTDSSVLILAVDRISHHVFPVAMPLLFLGAIGIFLLALALRRAGIAPIATPILVGLSIVTEFIPFPGITGDVVTWVLVFVGLGFVSASIQKMDNLAWDSGSVKALR